MHIKILVMQVEAASYWTIGGHSVSLILYMSCTSKLHKESSSLIGPGLFFKARSFALSASRGALKIVLVAGTLMDATILRAVASHYL